MSRKNRMGQVLNDAAKKSTPPPLTQRSEMYAPHWDNPNVQAARVLPKSKQPTYLDPGCPGILERKGPSV